jgi:hypothetical protein
MLFQNWQLKKAYFQSLTIFKRKYDDLQSLINNKILRHFHSSFHSRLEFEQELFQIGGLSLVTFLTNV